MFDPVAAAGLCPIEGFVTGLHDGIKGRPGMRCGNARADRYVERQFVTAPAALVEGDADSVGDDISRPGADPRQDDGELLTADSAHDVVRPEIASRHFGEPAEYSIA